VYDNVGPSDNDGDSRNVYDTPVLLLDDDDIEFGICVQSGNVGASVNDKHDVLLLGVGKRVDNDERNDKLVEADEQYGIV
jgi:hypothetical protein